MMVLQQWTPPVLVAAATTNASRFPARVVASVKVVLSRLKYETIGEGREAEE